MRPRDFCLDYRDSHGQDAHSQSLQCSTADETREVARESLDESSKQVQEASQANTSLTAEEVTEMSGCEGRQSGGHL